MKIRKIKIGECKIWLKIITWWLRNCNRTIVIVLSTPTQLVIAIGIGLSAHHIESKKNENIANKWLIFGWTLSELVERDTHHWKRIWLEYKIYTFTHFDQKRAQENKIYVHSHQLLETHCIKKWMRQRKICAHTHLFWTRNSLN